MDAIQWDRYPFVLDHEYARRWLQLQADLKLSSNTIDAYGRGLNDYLAFCLKNTILNTAATREHIGTYIRELSTRTYPSRSSAATLHPHVGLSNATMQQRLTIIRLYYDFLMDLGQRDTNPVGRGRYTPGKQFGGMRDRGLLPHYHKLPWIPNNEEWTRILEATKQENIRNRCMFAFAYDGALRREELCSLATHDVDPAYSLLTIRAETTKNRQGRVIPFSKGSGNLYRMYLSHRRHISTERGLLFLSESRRNYGQPLTIWSWSKIIHGIAARAEVPSFTTHTLRHLCLTDLARAGWELHDIARFAGHRDSNTTLIYIHLTGHDLAQKLARSLNSIHSWRTQTLAEVLL